MVSGWAFERVGNQAGWLAVGKSLCGCISEIVRCRKLLRDRTLVGGVGDAPTVWNSLPKDIRTSPTIASFRKKLKTYLYAKAYPP